MNSMARSNRKSLFTRLGSLGVLVAAALLLAGTQGCNQGAEGDRCNPALISSNPAPMYNEDECNAGLSCQQPKDCPEYYCCPTNGTSTNPFCQTGCNGGQASICAAGGMADCPDAG